MFISKNLVYLPELSSKAKVNRPPPFHLGYKKGLDGLRGLAIALVVLCHGELLGHGFGFIGVNTFFVLSGFLISTLLIAEWDHSRQISFRDFYVRRALRLLPALATMLAVFIIYVLVTVPASDRGREMRGAFWALFYFTNWAEILSFQVSPYLSHTWSLSIEEQFYFIWPLVLLFLLRNQSRRSMFCWILLGVFLSATARFLLFMGTDAENGGAIRLFFGLDTRADSLLLGSFVGICISSNLLFQPRSFSKLLNVCAVISAIGLLGLGFGRVTMPWMICVGWLLASVFAAILIASLVSANGWLRWFFENPVLVYVGRISYGLYIWHYPILIAMRQHHLPWGNLAYLLPVGVVTLASYYLVEAPCLRLKKRFSRAD